MKMDILTTDQHQFFAKNGYLLLKGFFPMSAAKAAGEWLRSQDQLGLAKTWTDQEPGVALAVYQNIHKGDSPIAKLASDPRVLQAASEIMEQETYIWSSKVNLKAAWCGTVEYYHQDYAYWRGRGYGDVKMLTCMTCLDPHSPKNGGLHVIPGSHTLGFVEHMGFINTNGLSKFMIPPKKLDQLSQDFGVLPIIAEPGDVLFFHAGLIHGSAHNISPDNRMIILTQMNTVGNIPDQVASKAKEFNLERASFEVAEAKRRLSWFEKKYKEQFESNDVTFNSPIPDAEKE